jgi:restriction system protein
MGSERGTPKVPQYKEFYWPVIRALKEIGGSASIAELYERVVADMKLSEDVLAVPHGDGTTSEVEYQLAWARSFLKKVGAVDNSERGIWALTSKGRAFTEKDAAQVASQVRSQFAKRAERKSAPVEAAETDADETDISWKEKLLGVLKSMGPDSFERLSQRTLRESGFTKVEVQGRSGDGGIDGAGVLRMNLVSFHVAFQCKRWKDAVSAPVIRDFRGAMIGRADKGLIITTKQRFSD